MSRPVVAHLTTVDLSLRYLLMPQLTSPIRVGIESVGISAAGEWVPELEAAGIRHVALAGSTRSMSVASDAKAAVSLWRILRRVRPDVLHTHNPKPGVYGRIVGRLAGVPVVVNTVHGLYAQEDDPLPKRVVVYLLEWLAARFSDAELVQSIEDLTLMRRLRLAPAWRLRHLGNGIDIGRFDPVRLAGVGTEVRAELGIPADRIVVGIVGRLVAEKGYRELLAAFERLDDRFVLVCVGPADPEKPDGLTEGEVRRATDGGVRFLGMRSDVDRLYAAMDVFVLPSHREGFPRSAMEAAATGLPVIATDIRGCREVVEDGVNGRLVSLGDIAALAAAIAAVGGDPEVRERMGAESRRKAMAEFDERAVVAKVLATYAVAARRRGLTDLARRLSEVEGPLRVRRAVAADAPFCALLHRDGISSGFLSSLGLGFLTLLYELMISDPDSVVLVAEDGSGQVGFVSGAVDTGRLYKRFIKRRGVAAALRALPALIRPSAVRKLWETVRYGAEGAAGAAVSAELLSMAVVPERRGRGIGAMLQERLFAEMAVGRMKVVVGSSNLGAVAAYRKAGFVPAGRIQVHTGESSEVLVWTRP